MADFSDIDPLSRPCLKDIEAVADRYLREGLNPACVLSALATVAIKTAQAEPQFKEIYLNYLADTVRAAAGVTITEE